MKLDKTGFGPLPIMRFLGKGDFKLLVLRVLKDAPMHGYEIMRVLEQRSHGFYKPSPGAIYPTLAALAKRGLVKGKAMEGRRAYSLTPAGKAYVRSREKEIEGRFRELERLVGPEKAAVMREFRGFGRLVFENFWSLSPKKAREVRGIVERFRRELELTLKDQATGGDEYARGD
jgi:DNA-binding PadR family transcriptional regulator